MDINSFSICLKGRFSIF